MSKKIILGIFIIFILGMVWLLLSKSDRMDLVSPQLLGKFTNITPTPTKILPKSPKTFQFDASTNLMEELEKVNPQISESDFE